MDESEAASNNWLLLMHIPLSLIFKNSMYDK